jgi:hypothetical protein
MKHGMQQLHLRATYESIYTNFVSDEIDEHCFLTQDSMSQYTNETLEKTTA